MPEVKLVIALIITILLALLIFRTNYTADRKHSKLKYWDKELNSYNYNYLFLDLTCAVTYAIIGCYLAWDSISNIQNLKTDFEEYKFLLSIASGAIFQQTLPILLEISMNKLNGIKNNLGVRK